MTTELEAKYFSLQSILKKMESIAIGYSGGVDSTLLIKVTHDILKDKALAVIGKSATYPSREYKQAVQIAEDIGIHYETIDTKETDNIKFKENPPDRCYYCKQELFSKIKQIAVHRNINWVADGTINDDLTDFRPGMKAKAEQNIRSPLLEAGLNKNDVRELSKYLGLPTWNKGSFACLASRFPYGSKITTDALDRINAAEEILYQLDFHHFRVRYHDENTCRIEVGQKEIKSLLNDEIRTQIVAEMKKIGFIYVTLDLQGYRTGSMNEVLPLSTKIP